MWETYIIVVLCIALIIMAAITANALSKLKETEGYYNSLHERHNRKVDKVNEVNREKHNLWVTIDELEKENEKLKALVEKYKAQDVSRETTYNKSYGMPEVVDYFNARYPGEEPK